MIETTYTYTGDVQTFTVPEDVTKVTIKAWGAQGGEGLSDSTSVPGALGGYAEGELSVTPGDVLHVYVGGQGTSVGESLGGGGYNGGGDAFGVSETEKRGGGGGASDVRKGGTDLNKRVIVAGGGGGSCESGEEGGVGGGTEGGDGSGSNVGTGGTQTAGGSGSGEECLDGTEGLGGSRSSSESATAVCAGGGGGYYGGGAGCGAGGGSSYISVLQNGSTLSGQRTGNGEVVITYDKIQFKLPEPLELTCQNKANYGLLLTQWLKQASAKSIDEECQISDQVFLDCEIKGDLTETNFCTDRTIEVEWKATDLCGNKATCVSFFTIRSNNIPPVITVPPVPLVLDCGDLGKTRSPAAQIDGWLAQARVWSNCDCNPKLTHDYNFTEINTCAPTPYTITVTWSATDCCGLTSTNSSTITVVPDTTLPQVFVPDPLVLDCGDLGKSRSPAAQIDGWLARAYATDNCDNNPKLTHDFDFTEINTCAPLPEYVITVTWTATDCCGLTATNSSTITVVPDTEDPVIILPPPLTVSCSDFTKARIPGAKIDDWLAQASVTDNCDPHPKLTHNFNQTDIDICADALYTIEVTWTATDCCGNSSTATSTITVIPDTEAPVITVPSDLTINCSDLGKSRSPAAIIDDWLAQASATDNWDPHPKLTHDFDRTDINICAEAQYVITVTWKAVDCCGNSSTATSTITVIPDTEAPVITVPEPLTIDCNDLGKSRSPAAKIDDWLAQASATDNWDPHPKLSYSFDRTDIDICALEEYTITVTWTAVDCCGNSSNATSTIIVIPDTEAPKVTPPEPIILGCSDVVGNSVVISQWLEDLKVSDNWDVRPQVKYEFEKVDTSTLHELSYAINVTWTVTDCCGNMTIVVSTIHVICEKDGKSCGCGDKKTTLTERVEFKVGVRVCNLIELLEKLICTLQESSVQAPNQEAQSVAQEINDYFVENCQYLYGQNPTKFESGPYSKYGIYRYIDCLCKLVPANLKTCQPDGDSVGEWIFGVLANGAYLVNQEGSLETVRCIHQHYNEIRASLQQHKHHKDDHDY